MTIPKYIHFFLKVVLLRPEGPGPWQLAAVVPVAPPPVPRAEPRGPERALGSVRYPSTVEPKTRGGLWEDNSFTYGTAGIARTPQSTSDIGSAFEGSHTSSGARPGSATSRRRSATRSRRGCRPTCSRAAPSARSPPPPAPTRGAGAFGSQKPFTSLLY